MSDRSLGPRIGPLPAFVAPPPGEKVGPQTAFLHVEGLVESEKPEGFEDVHRFDPKTKWFWYNCCCHYFPDHLRWYSGGGKAYFKSPHPDLSLWDWLSCLPIEGKSVWAELDPVFQYALEHPREVLALAAMDRLR